MKGHKLKWKPAQSHDAAMISDLLNLAYRGESSWVNEALLLDGQRASPALVKRGLKDPSTRYFVCRNDMALLACCGLTLVGNEAYIGAFAVLPAYQKSGVGTHLLEEIENICMSEYGVTLFSLPVLTEQDELKQFCEKRGYLKTGQAEAFPEHLHIGTPKHQLGIEFYLKKARAF